MAEEDQEDQEDIKKEQNGHVRKVFFRIEELPFCVEIIGDAFCASFQTPAQ